MSGLQRNAGGQGRGAGSRFAMDIRTFMETHDTIWWIAHTASAGAVVGAVLGIFTPLAAVVAFAFYSIQIYESSTVQKWFKNRKRRKIAHLRARLTKLTHPTEDD